MTSWISVGAAALVLAGAAAEAQPNDAKAAGLIRKVCHDDILQLCANTEPGGGRIGQCLRDHLERVSESCKSALASAPSQRRDRLGPPAGAPAPGSNR
jgi:hypothetical protein